MHRISNNNFVFFAFRFFPPVFSFFLRCLCARKCKLYVGRLYDVNILVAYILCDNQLSHTQSTHMSFKVAKKKTEELK